MKYNVPYESECIEFKASMGQLDKGIASLAAMLNKSGHGKVVLGVLDDREVVGLKDVGKETIKKVGTRIKEAIVPSVVPKVVPEEFDGKQLIVMEAKGDRKPYAFFGNYLVRVGSENRKLMPDELGDLFLSSSALSMSKLQAVNQKPSFNGLKSLYAAKGYTIDNSTFARNMGLLTSDGKYNYIADILSDENSCSIKVVRFKGENKDEMVARNEFGYKCMLLALKQAYLFVTSINETRVDLKKGVEREETKLFDEEALDEAWTNACLHNRWSRGIPPAMYIYSDRIEIVSTGGLPFDFSKREFFKGVSHPINESLMKIMGQLDFIEQTGHGVPLIVRRYGKGAFTFLDNSITVTIPFAFAPSFVSLRPELSASQTKLLAVLNENPTLTLKQLSAATGLGRTRVVQLLSDLKQAGRIERVGSSRSGYWKVAK